LPSSEPVIGELELIMYIDPEDAIANEPVPVFCCMNVDEPDTAKLLPVTVSKLPEYFKGANICSSLIRAIMQIYLLL
jgi:hypothetical protein